MRIKVLGSAQGNAHHQFAASYIVNETLAVDAGCLGFAALEEQRMVRHVVISHSHLDHIASLPIFLDNVLLDAKEPICIYGSDDVLSSLKQFVFNDRIWPDLERISDAECPSVRLIPLHSSGRVTLDDVDVLPVELGHVVPAFGFVMTCRGTSVAFISDTGPTEAIWEECNQVSNLKGVFLEAAFPESMRWLAEKACHLTPQLFLKEIEKLKHPVPVVAVHIKPAWYEEVVSELHRLNLRDLRISCADTVYEF